MTVPSARRSPPRPDRRWWSTAGPSLAGRAARIAARQVMAVLIVVGLVVLVGTGGLRLWLLDQALLDAAEVRAQAGLSDPLLVEHTIATRESLDVSVAEPGAALPYTQRRWLAKGRWWVSLPVEMEDLPGEPAAERHLLVVASAPLQPMVADMAALTVLYAVVAASVGLSVRWRLLAQMRDALGPLHSGALSAELLAERAWSPDAAAALRGQRLVGEGADEAGRFVASVNRLLDRIEAMLDESRRFTGNAAHELRTPVTAIRGELELALRRPRSAAELRATIEQVHDQVLGLGSLIDSLLLLARLDAGEEDASHRERVRASALLRAAAGEAFEGSIDAEVVVDRRLVGIALDNLVRNATVHGGGVVRAGLERRAGIVRFVVEDRGRAGEAAGLERPEDLFERFARGREASRVEGTGLGLSIVAEIARHHGGRARLEPRRGGGVRAILELPAAS